jgi:hypothetical protein
MMMETLGHISTLAIDNTVPKPAAP